MSVSLYINEDDFSDYVVDSERTHSICNPVATLDITLSPYLPRDIGTYEPVTFYENGVKVFTGYTGTVTKTRIPIDQQLVCYDELVRAKDSWISKEKVSGGESVGYWVGRFVSMSGITNFSQDASGDQGVFPGFSWDKTTCMEAITQTLQMSPYQIICDRNGVVRLIAMSRGAPVTTLNELISYERKRSDGWIRNRALVFGHGNFVADQFRSNPYLPGEVRAVVVATGAIYNMSTAESIAGKLLDEFANPLDVKVVCVPGDPDLEVGQTVRLVENWSDYGADCLITSLKSTYASDTYELELTLDEKCPNFWGWDQPPEEYIVMYCGTWGYGVYRSMDNGQSWTKTNLGNRYVYDIAVVDSKTVWAACRDGVFLTGDSGDTWITQNMGTPDNSKEEQEYQDCVDECNACFYPCYEDCINEGGDPETCEDECMESCAEYCDCEETIPVTESDLYWVSVVFKYSNPNCVYCLAGDFENRGIWVYYTENNGLDWSNARYV